MKQCKKREYNEIQNVENFGNFGKVVSVPLKLVLVPRLKNKVVTNLYRYPSRKKVVVAIWYRYHTYWYRYRRA